MSRRSVNTQLTRDGQNGLHFQRLIPAALYHIWPPKPISGFLSRPGGAVAARPLLAPLPKEPSGGVQTAGVLYEGKQSRRRVMSEEIMSPQKYSLMNMKGNDSY